MFDGCTDLASRSNVLIVCTTKYSEELMDLFGEQGNCAEVAPCEDLKNVHEVILLNSTTKEHRAGFFLGDSNAIRSSTLENVVAKFKGGGFANQAGANDGASDSADEPVNTLVPA